MKRSILTILALLAAFNAATAQSAKEDIIKTGLSFGPLPVVAFDNDKGFQYGALLNIYNFGNGDNYPNPDSQWYFEASRFTKGSQLYTVTYDNKVMIPGIRFSVAAQMWYDKALDFYGLNGYDSYYDAELPSGFYRLNRLMPYFKVDLTGDISEHLKWKAGYHFKYFKIKEFEPEGKNAEPLPEYGTLFGCYKTVGLISEDDADGGFSSALRFGLMYDTRDIENSPSRGNWSEVNFEYAPEFLGTSNDYLKYYFTVRQYVPLSSDKLVFAVRANVQGFVGTPAFYMLPFDMVSGIGYDKDGFGGYRTVRGVMRDRVQGKSISYFNSELRWKFLNFHAGKQNISLGLSGFLDGVRVIEKYPLDLMKASASSNTKVWDVVNYLKQVSFTEENAEKFHLSAGAGFRFIMNRNFIIAVEYGKPFNTQDNAKGAMYINTGYLF